MARPNPLSRAAEVAASLGKEPARPAPPSPGSTPDELPAPGARTSREGKRFLGYYVEPTRHDEIKQAALDEGIQIQELLRRAVDDWMQTYGSEAIAAVARRRERRRAPSR